MQATWFSVVQATWSPRSVRCVLHGDMAAGPHTARRGSPTSMSWVATVSTLNTPTF